MTITPNNENLRVLAIHPTTKGFGYAVMESAERLVDWGVKQARENKNSHCLRQVKVLIARYQPAILLIEDYEARGWRRGHRAWELLDRIAALATKGRRVVKLPRRLVKQTFSATGAATKYQIAQALSRRLPELGFKLPPPRRPWMSEDPRISIFEAAALACAYFHFFV